MEDEDGQDEPFTEVRALGWERILYRSVSRICSRDRLPTQTAEKDVGKILCPDSAQLRSLGD